MNQGLPSSYSNGLPRFKLFLLLLVTFGLYEVVWVYRNWTHLRYAGDMAIAPKWKTFWSFFPVAGLFVQFNMLKRLRNLMYFRDAQLAFPLYTYFWGGILLGMLGRLPGPLFLLGFLAFLPMGAVQGKLNQYWALEQPELPVYEGFTLFEIILIVLGSLCWVLLLIGMNFFPETLL